MLAGALAEPPCVPAGAPIILLSSLVILGVKLLLLLLFWVELADEVFALGPNGKEETGCDADKPAEEESSGE